MRYIITGKNIKVTEKLKSQIYEKFDKLDKYFAEETTAYVMLSVQKQMQRIEVTIPIKSHTIRAEQSSDDMYALSIDDRILVFNSDGGVVSDISVDEDIIRIGFTDNNRLVVVSTGGVHTIDY